MRSVEYDIDGKNKLYFFPEANRFSLNKPDVQVEPDFADTSVVKLRIEISHACNGRCKYCLVFGNNAQNFEVLNVEEFWKELKSFKWFKKLKSIFIIGGEPLLFYKEICFIIDNFDGRVSFSTNGTLLAEEMAEKFSKSNVSVYISLDGPTFEDNKNRVYVDEKYMYSDIIKGLELLKKHNVRFGIFMVASKETIGRAYDMIKYLDETYAPQRIGYSLPHWTPDYTEDLAQEFRDLMLKILKNRKSFTADIPQLSWRIGPILDGKVKKFSCGLHTSQVTVLPNKEFVRCSKVDNNHDDLKNKITNDILDKNSPVELAKDKNSDCNKCIAVASCGGGCPFDGMKRFGCITDKRECVITPAVVSALIDELVSALKNTDLNKIPDGLIKTNTIKNLL